MVHLGDNLTRQISLVAIGSLLVLSAYFIISSYRLHLSFKEKDQLGSLAAVVNTLQAHIDGDAYQELIRTFPIKDRIDVHHPIYQQVHHQLRKAHLDNQLESPVYLLTWDSEAGNFFFGVTSETTPNYRHRYRQYPQQLHDNYAKGGILNRYTTEHGDWLSAFAPIKNKRGETVAILQTDSPFRSFRAAALQSLFTNTIISILIVLLFMYFIKKYLRRVVGLVKEKEIAEQKAEIKARFLSTMSHEIRTPMNAVIGLTNILLEESPRKDQENNLHTLKFSADLLLALINDILDYSKLEAGKISFENIDIDLSSLVDNICKSMQVQAEKKQLPLIVDIAPDVPRYIIGDAVRLSQILTNLVSNAIKFTKKGRVCIRLTAKSVTHHQATIRFEVEDTGIGISKSKFETIFQSFSQADTATTRKFGGTGLGLSITKRLLELQNSQIQLLSTPGKGSTFFFDLKVPIGQSIASPANRKTLLPKEEIYFDGNPILLVEDNKINIMVALKFLKKWGFQVDVAEKRQGSPRKKLNKTITNWC